MKKEKNMEILMELINLKKELESTIEKLEVIREFESVINLKK